MARPERVTVDGIRSVSGRPFPECAAKLLPAMMPIPQATLAHLEERERTGIELIPGELYPGVAEGLPRLAERYPLFLVSNCPGWYLEAFFRHRGLRVLHRLGLLGSFGDRQIRDASEPRRALPPGAGGLRGGHEGDRAATEAAGMTFAFVRYGFGQVDDQPLSFDAFADLVRYFSLRRWQGPDAPADPHRRSL